MASTRILLLGLLPLCLIFFQSSIYDFFSILSSRSMLLVNRSLTRPSLSTLPTSLNLTAIAATGRVSNLECWQLDTRFIPSSQPGIVGATTLPLGAAGDASITVLPPHFDGGLHTAPAIQFVYFTAGLVHLTLPSASQEAWVRGGRHGLILAADTPDVSEKGHWTTYPSDESTVAIVVPTRHGKVPEHRVLHDGPCELHEIL